VSLDPIGIFDSGVGGLSVLKAIRQQLPHENIIYLADQVHVPFGPRPINQVRVFAEGVSRFLLDRGAKLIVVACNTASAAALYNLRDTFPDTPFVGMEPAVKPAAESTQSGVVGVLATPATFQGELYTSVVTRYANGITVLQDTCPGLVNQIEKGDLASSTTRNILQKALVPMLQQGVDRVVMGCTHYPFVIPLIEEIVGSQVDVIDPSPAVARQTGRVLRSRGLVNQRKTAGEVQFLTTGDPRTLLDMIPFLVGENGSVDALYWEKEALKKP